MFLHEYKLRDRLLNRYDEPVALPVKDLHFEARIALTLVERWGMVVCNTDGETTAGRQRLDIMPPSEVVERACETAALTVAEFERRGWVIDLPDFNSTEDQE